MDLLPDNHILCWDVFGFSYGYLDLRASGVERCGYTQDDIVGIELALKIGSEVYRVLDTRLGWLGDMCLELEW